MPDFSIKEYVFRKAARNKIPISGTFELTSRCNFNCKMCYIHMTPQEQTVLGSELSAGEWIQLGEAAVKEGMIYLLLTGGEPLLRSDFIKIYRELVKMGLLVTINTNGTLITPELIQCFREYKPEKINITLYGMSDLMYKKVCGNENGFLSVFQGIHELKKAGINLNLNTTFIEDNLCDMAAIVSYAKEMNIPVRTSSFLFPPIRNQHEKTPWTLSSREMGKAAAQFDSLTLTQEQIQKRKELIQRELFDGHDGIESIKDRRSSCMAGRGAFWISWNGRMYPCGMLPDYERDIRSISFKEAWDGICEEMTKVFLPKECGTCIYQKFCPSCAAVFQSVNGASDILSSELCDRTKAYIDAFMET